MIYELYLDYDQSIDIALSYDSDALWQHSQVEETDVDFYISVCASATV